jgi:MYXO-CTERM domain-containing protein
VQASLELQVRAPFDVEDLVQGHSQLSVSSNGKGRSLILSEELSPTHLGFAIRGEFLSDDGAPTPKPMSNGDAGDRGEAGEGGDAGSSVVASGSTSAQAGSSGASAGGGASKANANGGALSGDAPSTQVAPSLSSCSLSERGPASGFAWGLVAVAAALSARRRRML